VYTMEACSETSVGGDDTLWGVGAIVNVGNQTSVSYPATAVVEVNAENEGYQTAGDTALAEAIAREGGVDKEILQTRYMAGGPLSAATQFVLTFPTGRQPGPSDPIATYFFDEDENRNFSPRLVTLPQEVNVCTLAADETGTTLLSCPGEGNTISVVGPSGNFTSGWVRLINNTVGEDGDALDTLPATRFPVLGFVFITTLMGEVPSDEALPLQWVAIVGSGGFGGGASFTLTPPQRFAPWRLPNATKVMPGDNTTGGLPLSGSN
jgi:hypothetical protein